MREAAMLQSQPSLSVVIPAYRHAGELRATLDSLYQHTRLPFEVLVVDSGAASEPVRDVVDEPHATYMPVANHGFAAACNAGIRRARGPFIALLNPDVRLHDDALGALVAFLKQDLTVGCVGPRLLRVDGSIQPYAYGAEPQPGALLRRGLGRLRGKRDITMEAVDRPLRVAWVAGTCLVARRKALEEVGLLDERYFLYWEDVDWCLRARRFGWNVVWHPGVSIVHIGGVATGAAAPHHYYRSLARFYRNWYGGAAALGLEVLLRAYGPLAALVRRRHAHRD